MRRLLAVWALALAVAATALAGGPALADAPGVHGDLCAPAPPDAAAFAANTNRIGLVDLHFFFAYGATVTYYECSAGRAYPLGERSIVTSGVLTSFLGAVQWRCGRLTRRFAATAVLAGGRFVRGITSVRTMSCAHRFTLEAPRRLGRGQIARVRVVDRWGIGGLHTRLCYTAPSAARYCQSIGFAPAATVARRSFRPATVGQWAVELQVGPYRVRSLIAVGVKSIATKAPPTLLATGDSTMQGVDSFLGDDLGDAATVLSDVRPGFSLGHDPAGWPVIAASQVATLRPTTTVMSLGADEGFPIRAADGTTHGCCDEAWVAQYASQVRQIMQIYRRNGLGRVFYLTIAAPRVPARAVVVDAVNRAIIRAGAGLPGVRVLRMDLLFSPHGYQEVVRYQGQDVPVREADGVHLNVAGTAIEAREVVRALRGG